MSSPRLLNLIACVILVFASVSLSPAQKIDKKQLAIASRRLANATKVINDVSALPATETIPKQLLDRAEVIAVFPDTKTVNLLYQRVMKGYGVSARRVENGWSTPAFYAFAMQQVRFTGVKPKAAGIIMLFMTDQSQRPFAPDRFDLSGEPGPVGELTPETQKELTGARVIVYALADGKLSGVKVGAAIKIGSVINSDNNINEAIFGLKAREVIWSKTPIQPPTPEIVEFQKALVNLTPR
jgi:lipid-binding SYLF domain-containing protein